MVISAHDLATIGASLSEPHIDCDKCPTSRGMYLSINLCMCIDKVTRRDWQRDRISKIIPVSGGVGMAMCAAVDCKQITACLGKCSALTKVVEDHVLTISSPRLVKIKSTKVLMPRW